MILDSAVNRSILYSKRLIACVITMICLIAFLGESRYEPNGAPTVAQHCVATLRNRITIPHRCALFCTTVDAPFNSSNCGF